MTTRETAAPFLTLEIMYSVAEQLVPVVRDIKRFDRNLADQLQRAATSVALNLAEGSGVRDGNRRRHFSIATGSLHEVRAALRMARIWNYTPATTRVEAELDRVAAMTYRLLHPK
ncbi:MAG: four helix bundle protein [Sandaracinaceae bacterium]|nr:four helix bundle protein [Sandaracinaceae bacterium]MBK8169479.1 four helix bundle protein [Sandaracinaceae bacterium]